MQLQTWWLGAVEAFFDLAPTVAADLLTYIDDPSCWMLGADGRSRLIRFPPGPRRLGARAALFRADPGAVVLLAASRGGEVLILQGTLRANGRTLAGAGQRLVLRRESNELLMLDGPECLWCAVSRRPGPERSNPGSAVTRARRPPACSHSGDV